MYRTYAPPRCFSSQVRLRRKRQGRFSRALTIAVARSTSSRQMRAVQATKYCCPGILSGREECLPALITLKFAASFFPEPRSR
jgi:hypothetical protein